LPPVNKDAESAPTCRSSNRVRAAILGVEDDALVATSALRSNPGPRDEVSKPRTEPVPPHRVLEERQRACRHSRDCAIPGLKTDKSVRFSVFVDGGNVFGQDEKISFGDLRYSAGVGVSWFSPVGPLKFNFGVPIKKKEGDKIERFQFQLGTVF